MLKRWRIKSQVSEKVRLLGKEYSISPVVIQLLLDRGIDNFKDFLYPSVNSLFEPSLLPDIDKGVERVRRAIESGEHIFIYGDYDVDGITSLTILNEYLKHTKAKYSFYIPHRLYEGYGLNKKAITEIKDRGAKLIVCLDCGTNSYEEVSYAKQLGIDIVIIDHHQPKDGLNIPYAFINPRRKDSLYPFKELSSACLAFKFVQMLGNRHFNELMGLAALSVVCDVVPVIGENRIILSEGIKILRKAPWLAIKSLCKVAGIKTESIDVFHLGYILGPRINSSGRMESAHLSLDLFLCDDDRRADFIAQQLNNHNKMRQNIEANIMREAVARVEGLNLLDNYALVIEGNNWHIGVLGIVASHLVERYYRPTFVLSCNEKIAKGSGRSPEAFPLIDALNQCSQYLHNYGGHKKAAGVEIFNCNIDMFRNELNLLAKKMLTKDDLTPLLEIDLELLFSDVDISLAENINLMKPFGESNPEPLFITRRVKVKAPPQKINNGMFNVWLTDGRYVFEGVFYEKDGFRYFFEKGGNLDIVYNLRKNNFYNAVKLFIRDIRTV